jgi:hypothetical protein
MPRAGALPFADGVIADGVVWPDGAASLRWRGPYPFTADFTGLEAIEHAYGMAGQIVFVFGPDPMPDAER